ncbi:hypothetical protein GGS21DRAFT_127049 [Xylaria nigripes]|nr:hypothetical protein GGS21DRAFT_127049 [Xylaria nigripes]
MPESPKISSRTRSERESPENGESSKSNDISGSSTASKTRAPEKVENSESSSGMSSRRSRRKHDSQTRQAEPSHASISRSQTTVPDTSESALDSNNNLQQTRPKGSLKRHESKATQTDEPPSAMRSNTEPQIIIPDTPKHTDKHHPGFPKTRSKSSPRRHESQKRHAELSHTSSAKPQLRVVEIAKRANDPDTGLVKTRSQSRPKRHESQRRQPEPPRVEKSNLQIPVPETSQNSVDPVPASRAKGTLREREMQYAFSTTRRNLTHISQFMLKLEARTGKATKEGIRNTLDATVNDKNYNLSATPDYFAEIEELKHMSDNIYTRLFLIDRHWRRIARNRRKEEGKSPDIRILSEPDIKDWLRVELQTNHLVAEETSYFTVRDLANGRSFREWIQYLRVLCEFRDHPHDEAKLVDLAWLFLDRNLRGPRPSNPTTGEQLIAELEAKKRSGFWADALQNAMKQEEDDAEAWRTMRRYWSSRTAPA